MKHTFAIVLIVLAALVPARAVEVDHTPGRTQTWTVWGGSVGVRWNRDLAADIGLQIGPPIRNTGLNSGDALVRFAVRPAGSLKFSIANRNFQGFRDGSLRIDGGYVVELDGGRIDLTGFQLVPRSDNSMIMDIVSGDGEAWFYTDRWMYALPGADDILRVRTMDLRISPRLANRLGQPIVAGWVIADMELETHVLRWGGLALPAGTCNVGTGDGCNFAGTPAPGAGTYQADLFMLSFSPQYSRCQACSGPGGSGQVVFTPTSTLKNNVNAGSIQTTVQGQGALGVSSALWAADIPWFEKFSGDFPPYANDQHPYLIWNMYRIDADGHIVQIGRSGLKHAFFATNVNCTTTGGHVLRRACEDTYTVSNNDNPTALGPRSEIIAASNKWGRCGSIYDPDCNGIENNPGNGSYDQRLIVRESEIDNATHPGSSWLFESWYLAREDINVYNSMGSVATTQLWTGSVWAINASGYELGPAIDRWVDPANPGPNASNAELDVAEGHAKVAVKVSNLGNGTWRYDYAVMNLDFARAETANTQPGNTDYLQVLSNHGFDSFAIPVLAGSIISAPSFSDGDMDAGNDWALSTTGNTVVFTAPVGNALDWGSMFSFSITVNAVPGTATTTLHVAQAGTPAAFDLSALAPVASEVIFADGFEAAVIGLGTKR